jgi:predicted RNA-binding Zn ribbon-like protein
MGGRERERTTRHHTDPTSKAPGDLELVRGFLALHEHRPDDPTSFPPSHASLARWLRDTSLLAPSVRADEEELVWATTVRDDLRSLIGVGTSGPGHRAAIARLDAAASDAGVAPRFGPADLRPTAAGIRGAIGHVLALAFLARLDGSWDRLRHCSNPTCLSVFYDSSKNRSGRWCSMRACGNQAKVRAFRERRRAEGAR